MLKEFSWHLFEKTGNINSYILFKELNTEHHTNGSTYRSTELIFNEKLSDMDAV